MSNLQIRVLSAVVALGLILGVYSFFEVSGVLVLGIIIVLIGSWEYSNICISPLYKSKKVVALFLGFCAVLLPLFSFSSQIILPGFAASVCLFFTLALWLSREQIKITHLQQLLSMTATGFIYCTLFPSFAIKILLLDNGMQFFMCLLAIIFAGDSFAYFCGRAFGKHRLMPALSPNKTVEGAIGGAIGSILVCYAYSLFFDFKWPIVFILILAGFTSFVAQTGDLFESLLKRNAKVKDSGKIMPGHGGVLDRLDGVFFGAPIFYAIYFTWTTYFS